MTIGALLPARAGERWNGSVYDRDGRGQHHQLPRQASLPLLPPLLRSLTARRGPKHQVGGWTESSLCASLTRNQTVCHQPIFGYLGPSTATAL